MLFGKMWACQCALKVRNLLYCQNLRNRAVKTHQWFLLQSGAYVRIMPEDIFSLFNFLECEGHYAKEILFKKNGAFTQMQVLTKNNVWSCKNISNKIKKCLLKAEFLIENITYKCQFILKTLITPAGEYEFDCENRIKTAKDTKRKYLFCHRHIYPHANKCKNRVDVNVYGCIETKHSSVLNSFPSGSSTDNNSQYLGTRKTVFFCAPPNEERTLLWEYLKWTTTGQLGNVSDILLVERILLLTGEKFLLI